MPRILYVEDHADTREAISKLLSRAGYELDVAESGQEALAFAFAETPDVLLLDLALPQMDGIELIQVLRCYLRMSEIPVVILSALAEGPLIEAAKALNVSSILVKNNASFDQILLVLQNALTKRPPSGKLPPEKRSHGNWPQA